MEIARKNENGVELLELSGRFDELAAPEAERTFNAILQENPPRILLDMTGVEYISSSGMRVLLMVLRVARKNGATLKLCGLSPFVAEVFEVSNFSSLFEIHPRCTDALAAFA